MKRDYRDYLEDIIESIDKIRIFTDGFTLTQFSTDDKTQLAVVKSLEIIGEAVKKLPASFKKKFPAVPWRSHFVPFHGLTEQSVLYSNTAKNSSIVNPAFEIRLRSVPRTTSRGFSSGTVGIKRELQLCGS